jgi:hypothetical protein
MITAATACYKELLLAMAKFNEEMVKAVGRESRKRAHAKGRFDEDLDGPDLARQAWQHRP